MDTVSIIIPVFNAKKYLAECIESVLNQTYKDIEVIAVNDGSTDNSLEILKKYEDKIKIISKENGGTASALNTGMGVATGEWIIRLDSDDLLYLDALEVLVSEARKISDKTNIMLYADYDLIDSNGVTISSVLEPNYNGFSKFDFNVVLLDHQIGSSDTLLVHKSTFEKYGHYDGKFGFEDYEIRLRFCLVHNCSLYHIPRRVAKYRIHSDQLTMTDAKRTMDLERIRKNILDQLDSVEREKYKIALAKYKKNKPIILKLSTYAGYYILPYLPKSLSLLIAKLYRSIRHPLITQT